MPSDAIRNAEVAPPTKILFVAFDGTDPTVRYNYSNDKGAVGGNQRWIDSDYKKEKVTVQVWYDGKPDPFMSSLNTGSIYIRGHGEPGCAWIRTGGPVNPLHYTEIVDRLIESGLQKTFSGKIKCYSCHSAESAPPSSDPAIGIGDPLAQLVTDELWNRGYKSCQFFGYAGTVDSYPKPESRDRGGELHRFVRAAGNTLQSEGRAREHRYEFWARPLVQMPPKVSGFSKFLMKIIRH